MLNSINKLLARFGYVLKKDEVIIPADISQNLEFMGLYEFCKPYTMTSVERMFGLYQAVRYVVDNNVSGDFVECGVWKGGSSMLIAKMLSQLNVQNRNIYLYDTFEGMSTPGDIDREYTGVEAKTLLNSASKEDPNSVWCFSSLEEVRRNLEMTGFPMGNIELIKGKVEDTIPAVMPSTIALLRLDTDWYESTYHELKNLFPVLQSRGVLIVDDFGHWEGAKKAVLQFFNENRNFPLYNRIDYTGRLIIKS